MSEDVFNKQGFCVVFVGVEVGERDQRRVIRAALHHHPGTLQIKIN